MSIGRVENRNFGKKLQKLARRNLILKKCNKVSVTQTK